ncbi:MAG: CsbD family protein [Pseudomonadota bacterium]
MNQDQMKGAWEQVKGRAKMAWGELTDDDIMKAEGSADKLYGVIQEKFGDTKESIKDRINNVKLK